MIGLLYYRRHLTFGGIKSHRSPIYAQGGGVVGQYILIGVDIVEVCFQGIASQ